MDPVILDLCGGTGSWSKPYKEAGYDVRLITLPNQDVRLYRITGERIHGILAAPPCDHFAVSGARWWNSKGEKALFEGLSVVDACLRIIHFTRPNWWCLENPVGRLKDYLGPPLMIFDPCDYGDGYTKKTCLWGEFRPPLMHPVAIDRPGYIHRIPPSEKRKELRSITPGGFANAFFKANP